VIIQDQWSLPIADDATAPIRTNRSRRARSFWCAADGQTVYVLSLDHLDRPLCCRISGACRAAADQRGINRMAFARI
jgi:hypothetical protein